MQIATSEEQPQNNFKIKNLTPEESGRLVDVFAWLIKQDKRQNPALYELKRSQDD